MSDAARFTQKLDDAGKRQLVRITARSFFDEMVDYGFDERDVINFTTEILDLLIHRDNASPPRLAPTPRVYKVDYKLDPSGKVAEVLGPQLSLRPLSPADRPILAAWRENASYRGTLIEWIFDPGIDEIFRRFGSERSELFLVRLQDGVPLGFVTYQRDANEPERAEMQKFLADMKQRGRGYGHQMTYLWLHYGFTRLNLRKITARMVDSNLPNINLNRKLGFRFEGHLRQEVRLGDSLVDLTVMSALKEQALPLLELSEEPSDSE